MTITLTLTLPLADLRAQDRPCPGLPSLTASGPRRTRRRCSSAPSTTSRRGPTSRRAAQVRGPSCRVVVCDASCCAQHVMARPRPDTCGRTIEGTEGHMNPSTHSARHSYAIAWTPFARSTPSYEFCLLFVTYSLRSSARPLTLPCPGPCFHSAPNLYFYPDPVR